MGQKKRQRTAGILTQDRIREIHDLTQGKPVYLCIIVNRIGRTNRDC